MGGRPKVGYVARVAPPEEEGEEVEGEEGGPGPP